MSEYEPELLALAERVGRSGHSLFAPSGAAGWMNCARYLVENAKRPNHNSFYSVEGTVGHHVGQEWLTSGEEPTYLLDTTMTIDGFEIEIDENMLFQIGRYVEWVKDLPGEHYVEQRVDFSDLTPAPNQTGTADHFVCEWLRLTVTDLKYGKGIMVHAERNFQLMIYAYGVFKLWDWLYNFQTIVIRIAQPRLDHFDTWECTREELLEFADFVRERALAAWTIDAPATPSLKACEWCRDIDCPARLHMLDAIADDTFEDYGEDGRGGVPTIIEAEYTVVEQRQEIAVVPKLRDLPDPVRLTTKHLALILSQRKPIERFLAAVEAELENRSADEEIPGFKRVEGRAGRRAWLGDEEVRKLLLEIDLDPTDFEKTELLSPAKVEDTLRKKLGCTKKQAAGLIASVVNRPPGRQTLVQHADKREALALAGDVFDSYEDDDADL